MTDLENFKTMLERRKLKIEETDWGVNISVAFEVFAGGFGSTSTWAEAFFQKNTGEFLAIHHCD